MASKLIPISLKVPADALAVIDANAAELGMNRSEYLIAQGTAPEAARALKLYEGLRGIGDRLAQIEGDVDALLEGAEE